VPFLGISDVFDVCAVSEWMTGGSLAAFLQAHPENDRTPYVGLAPMGSHASSPSSTQIRGIVSGLGFMHRLGVVHGDMKAVCVCRVRDLTHQADALQANVLVDADFNPRLADFGLTTILYNSPTAATTMVGSAGGTVRWMAPELHDEDDGHGSTRPSVRSDIYALAITFWEVRAPRARRRG
jgi:serine/threonine protein kinase